MRAADRGEDAVRVLIAIDDSPHSQRALRSAPTLRWPAGSPMVAVSAVPASPSADLRRAHETLLSRAQSRLRRAGHPAEGVLLEGDPREALLRIVVELRADLLVLGSRGRSGIARLMLGSVSAHSASHAPCSVLVVKQPRGTSSRRRPTPNRGGSHADPDRSR